MWTDKNATFCKETAVGGSTGKRLLGDVIDTGENKDFGVGNNLFLVVQVATTFTSGGSATAVITLASDAQAAVAVDDSETVHLTSASFAVADCAAGTTLLVAPLPMEASGKPYERYLGVIADIGTAALTAGAINAFLTPRPPKVKAYPDGAR
jgi:hypothetical protein